MPDRHNEKGSQGETRRVEQGEASGDGRRWRVWRNVRYDWPAHFALLVMNLFPDNTPFLRLRGALVGAFLGRAGRDLRIGRNVSIYNPAFLTTGQHVYFAHGCVLIATAPIRIEDEVMLGPYCVLAADDHTSIGGSFRYGPPSASPIGIERGAWLGAHVVVTAGATIGRGTAIGAGAVVRGNIPDGVVAVGIPARPVKTVEGDSVAAAHWPGSAGERSEQEGPRPRS